MYRHVEKTFFLPKAYTAFVFKQMNIRGKEKVQEYTVQRNFMTGTRSHTGK